MATSSQIEAGGAFVRVTAKDDTADGLRRAQGSLKTFAGAVRAAGADMANIGRASGRALATGLSAGIKAARAVTSTLATNIGRGLEAGGKALKSFGDKIGGTGRSLLTLGAIGFAPLVAATRIFSTFGSELHDAADRTGVAVEALGALRFAADQSDVSFEDLQGGLKFMQKNLAGAAAGGKEMQSALADLGLTVGDLAGLSPDKQFELIADRISKINDPALRAAAAMKIFGRGGAQLLPLLREGASGIRRMTDEFRAAGLEISGADAAAADTFGDSLGKLLLQFKTLTFTVGATIVKAIQPFVGQAQRATAIAIGWIKENRGLVISFAKLGAGIATSAAVGGVALLVLGKAFSVIGAGVSVAGAGFKVLGTLAGAMLTPMGLVTAALVAGTGAFLYFSGYGAKALQFISDRFTGLKSDAINAFHGIADALRAGEIELAGQIVVATLKLGWLEFKDFIIDIARSIRDALAEAMINGAAEGLKALEKVKAVSKGVIVDAGDAEVAGPIVEKIAATEKLRDAAKSNPKAAAASARALGIDVTPETIVPVLDKTIAKFQQDLDIVRQSNAASKAQIDPETQAKLDAIEKNRAEQIKLLNATKTPAGVENEAELERLRDELAKLVEQAKLLRERRQAEDRNPNTEPPKPPQPEADAGELLASGKGDSSRSQFGGLNAELSLGGPHGHAAEDTAANTKRTAEGVQALPERIGAAVARAVTGGGNENAPTKPGPTTQPSAPPAGPETEGGPPALQPQQKLDKLKAQFDTVGADLREAIDRRAPQSVIDGLRATYDKIAKKLLAWLPDSPERGQAREAFLRNSGQLTTGADAKQRVEDREAKIAQRRRERLGPIVPPAPRGTFLGDENPPTRVPPTPTLPNVPVVNAEGVKVPDLSALTGTPALPNTPTVNLGPTTAGATLPDLSGIVGAKISPGLAGSQSVGGDAIASSLSRIIGPAAAPTPIPPAFDFSDIAPGIAAGVKFFASQFGQDSEPSRRSSAAVVDAGRTASGSGETNRQLQIIAQNAQRQTRLQTELNRKTGPLVATP
jgi:hypothetical protein